MPTPRRGLLAGHFSQSAIGPSSEAAMVIGSGDGRGHRTSIHQGIIQPGLRPGCIDVMVSRNSKTAGWPDTPPQPQPNAPSQSHRLASLVFRLLRPRNNSPELPMLLLGVERCVSPLRRQGKNKINQNPEHPAREQPPFLFPPR